MIELIARIFRSFSLLVFVLIVIAGVCLLCIINVPDLFYAVMGALRVVAQWGTSWS